jgi:hypothetical protein
VLVIGILPILGTDLERRPAMNTAREILTADFQAKKKDKGLKDLKFFLGNVSDSTVEDVCAVVLKVYDEVDKKNFIIQKSWNDSQKPKATTA